VFPLWVSRLDATCLHKIAYLALLDWILALHIVPRIRYLGFTTRGKKGPLTTTGDLSACKSKRTLIQLLTVNREIDGSRAGGREGRKDVPDFARHFILFRSIHIEIEIRECVCVCQHYSIPKVWNSYSIPEPTACIPFDAPPSVRFLWSWFFSSGPFGAHLCRGLFSSARLFLRAVRFVAHTRPLAL
jgi:hypothetical protein